MLQARKNIVIIIPKHSCECNYFILFYFYGAPQIYDNSSEQRIHDA